MGFEPHRQAPARNPLAARPRGRHEGCVSPGQRPGAGRGGSTPEARSLRFKFHAVPSGGDANNGRFGSQSWRLRTLEDAGSIPRCPSTAVWSIRRLENTISAKPTAAAKNSMPYAIRPAGGRKNCGSSRAIRTPSGAAAQPTAFDATDRHGARKRSTRLHRRAAAAGRPPSAHRSPRRQSPIVTPHFPSFFVLRFE